MKIIFSSRAEDDLESIIEFLLDNYPSVYTSFVLRMDVVFRKILEWPRIATRVVGQKDIHVIPMVRYPYKIFYKVTPDGIEILQVSHDARRPD